VQKSLALLTSLKNHMKRKSILFSLLFVSIASIAFSQYPVSTIPANLLQDADMVIRQSNLDVLIKSKGNAIVRKHFVYTILNSSADDYANCVAHYDKLSKVSNIEGNLYDASGIKIRSIKKSEIKDYSNTSESNLADADRVKFHSFSHKAYPYTVEYTYEIDYDGIFHLPSWIPVINEKVSVQASNLKIAAPADYILRFKSFNYTGEPQITEVKKNKEYSWILTNYPALKEEVYAPSWHEITPAVLLAPSNFEMQKYSGSMNNWQEFGNFMYQLNAGRDELTASVKEKVQSLTKNLSTTTEKVNILYNFLQKNTRYISIQLGIGGWQTLDANFVATNGYGDCKALTNYMFALLKEAGIKSHVALVKAGRNEDEIIKDFTSNQFNHVILCVPNNKDSIWLECTNQNVLPGYMGSFTGNRNALLITENGGVLVNTPAYKPKDNLQVRSIIANVDEQGNLQANISTKYNGLQQDRLDGYLTQMSKEDLKSYMANKFELSSYEVENYSHTKTSIGSLPSISEEVKLKVANYASVTGKRLFINPNILSASSFKIKDASSRKFGFHFNMGFTDYDTVQINIPLGYKAESLPGNTEINMGFAKFASSVKIEGSKIIYTRYFYQEAVKVPADKTKELAAFFDKIYKADHARIVFVKEEG